MKKLRRLKRMSRNRGKIGKMNLTSLMDVFTILVFFLLVNSGNVEVLEAPKNVRLPESMVESAPRETVVIFVSPDDVSVQGTVVAQLADLLDSETNGYASVADRLTELRAEVADSGEIAAVDSQEITILADKSVPFIVIRKLMSLCTAEGFENVSLAVTKKASQVAAN